MRRVGRLAGCFLTLTLGTAFGAPQAPRCPKPVDLCIAEKRQLFEKRGVLGFLFSPVAADESVPHLDKTEYLVRSTPAGYPAAVAGLKEGDLLLAMDGKRLLGMEQAGLDERFAALAIGQTVSFKVLRQGKELTVRIPAAKPGRESIDAWIGRHLAEAHSREDYRHYLLQQKAGGHPPRQR